jgi:hypothetical protein
MRRLSIADLRTLTTRSRASSRGPASSRQKRWTRPDWQFFHAGFERLEDRTVLSGITANQVAAIESGLGALSGLGTQLNGFNQYAQNLNVLDTSLSGVLDIHQTFSSDLSTPASSYLGQAGPTASGLATALSSSTSGNSVTVTGSQDASGKLTFTVVLDVTRTESGLTLDLGSTAKALGLTTAATVNLSVELKADFTITVSSDSASPADQFLLSFTNPLSVTGTVSTTNLSGGLDVGFLAAQINNGTVNLTAEVDANASQALGTSQLTTSNLTLTPTSSFSATLPLSISLGGTSLSGSNPTITLSDSNLFGGAAPSVSTSNFGGLLDFTNLSSPQVVSDLTQLGGWFNQFRNTALFNTTIPFTGGQTLGSVLDLGTAYTNTLLNGLETVLDPTVAPGISQTGGGTSGGNLAAGSYVVQYSFVNSHGESPLSPASGSITITAGQIPQVTLPQVPSGDTINLYLSDSSATSGSETLYASGITSTTYNLATAAPSGVPAPPAMPLSINPTGGGTSGGHLAAGSYLLVYTFVGPGGESAASGASAPFTITAGQIPQVTFPKGLPSEFTINLYLSDSSATPGSETRYASGIASSTTTYNLSTAAASGQPSPVFPPKSSPAFVTAQDLLNALVSSLGLSTSVVNAQYDSTNDDINFTVNLQDTLPALTVPLNFNLNLGPLGQVTTAAELQITPMATLSFTFGESLTPSPAVLSGLPPAPIPASGSFGPTSFSLAIGSSAPVSVSISSAASYSSIYNASNADDTTTLVGQLNKALQNAGVGSEVVAGFVNNAITLSLQSFSNGRTIQITNLSSTDPLATVLGFVNGEVAHAGSSGLFISNASAGGSVSLAVVNSDPGQPFASAQFGPLGIVIGQGALGGTASVTASVAGSSAVYLSSLTNDLGNITSLVPSLTPMGSLTATLSQISVAGGLLSALVGDPTFTITVPDITNPTNVQTSESDFGALLNFQHLSFSQIFFGLQSAVMALSTYQDFGFLNQKLPVINKSLVDLVDYGAGLAGALTGLGNNQPSVLQGLTTALDTALGLPPSSNLISLSYDSQNTALKVDIQYDPSYDQTVPLNLNLAALAALAGDPSGLQGVGQLIDISGSSNLHVHAGASVTLDLGISLSNPLSPSAFLYSDTGASLSLLLAATDIHFNASIGPLGVAITGGTATISADGVSTTQPATFTIGLNPSDGSNTGQPTLSEFLGNIKGEVTTKLTAGAGLNLPISVISPSLDLGSLSITIPDLNALFAGTSGAVMITTPDIKGQLSHLGSLSTLLTNPTVFLNPLDSLLGDLQSALNSQVLQSNLPLIGSHLGDAAQFIQSFRTNVIQSIENAIMSAPNGDPTQLVVQALTSVFGSSGLNVLDGSVTETAPDNSSLQFNMHLHQDLATVNVPISFDLGLPGLALNVNGGVTLKVGWDFYFDFGISTSDGLYLVTNPTDSQGNPVPVFTISIDATIPGLSAQGNLFFLQINANDGDPTYGTTPTDLNGAFTVNLTSPSNDGRLTVKQLIAGPLSSIVSPVLSATADVNLHLVASVGGSGAFPSFSTNFALTWSIDADPKNGLTLNPPEIDLNDVTIDLGTFISNFVTPILDKVNTVLGPVEPIINLLQNPIPVISDLAGQPISLITIAETLEPSLKPGIQAFLDAYNLFIQLESDVASAGAGGIMIDLGSFDLNKAVSGFESAISSLNGLKKASIDTSKLPSAADLISQIKKQGGSMNSQNFTKNITKQDGSIQFPILTDPASVLQIFLGQTVNLFTFDTPKFTLGFTYTAMFEIFGPLLATLTGNVSATIQFSFGYDTYGIQEFSDADYDPSALPDLLDGFYVVAGQPNVVLNAGIAAGAELSIGIADAGVQGGIYATVSMSLHDIDHTGKLRIGELGQEILTMPQCLFDVSGDVYVQLTAYFDVNLFLFSIHKSFDITPPIVLFSFNYSCPPPTPVLATPIDGVLYLNMGPRASDRVNGNLTSTDEQFTVSHVSGSAGNETVNVSAFGYTQSFNNVTAIVGDAGSGSEMINCSSVESPTYLTPGKGSDKFIGGSGTNTVIASASTISSSSAPFTGATATALSHEEPASLSTSSFTLSNGSLEIGSVGTDSLTSIQNVILVGSSSSATTFNVSDWSGTATLIGKTSGNSYSVQLGGGGTTTIRAVPPAGNSEDEATITGSSTNDPMTISATRTTQDSDVVNYDSNLASLTVNGGAGNTTYNILSTLGGSSTTTLNTGDGDDTVNVQTTAGTTTLNLGAGTDTVNAGSNEPNASGVLAGIQGALSVVGGSGSDTLNLDDTGDAKAQTGALTANSLTGLGMGQSGVTYSGLVALNLNLGTGGDTINVPNTASGTSTAIVASAHGLANTINVGSKQPSRGGNLAGIQGPLNIQGGGSDTANVDDTGDTTVNRTGTLTATTLTGLGMGPQGITYSGLSALNIGLGSGGNTFNAKATVAPTTTTVTAATGTNTFNIGSLAPSTGGIVGGVQGPLRINGSGNDTANVDDTGDKTVNQSGELTESALTGLGMGPKGIAYSGIAVLNISLGSGANHFTIDVSSGANLPAMTTIRAGASNANTLGGTWGGDLNGNLQLFNFAVSTFEIGGNFNGVVTDTNPGYIQSISIGGSLTASGKLLVSSSADPAIPTTAAGLLGDIGTMTVGGSIAGLVQVSGNIVSLVVGVANTPTPGDVNDISGEVIVGGSIGTASVSGNVSGLIERNFNINSLYIGGSLTQSGIITVPSATVGKIEPALQNLNILTIGDDLAGMLWVPGTLGTATIGGSLASTGIVTAGNLNSATIQQNLAGQLNVAGALKVLVVGGATPGTISASQIGTIGVYAGYGPLISQIEESGVPRQIAATPPAMPFAPPQHAGQTSQGASSPGIQFQYFYEGTISPLVEGLTSPPLLVNPKVTIRVNNRTGNKAPDQFDLSLVTYNDVSKLNLSRLDATGNSGVSGIGNVDVEGDILNQITSASASFFAPDPSPAGVYLPKDNLASVSVRDIVPVGSIAARSIQAVAFGSMTPNPGGTSVSGALATPAFAAELLAAGTAIVQAGSVNGSTVETFRVPFADRYDVGFFMDDTPGSGRFDSRNVALEVEGVSTPNSTGTGNIVTPSNVSRGSVIALVTVAETFNPQRALDDSLIESISMRGDGGSIQTQQTIGSSLDGSLAQGSFTPAITSTGPLGDVTIQGPLPDVTAPSIFGSILPSGAIPATTTIQTTGIRIDPITGAVSQVPADLGRVFVTTSPSSPGPVETSTVLDANGAGLAGQIICGGNLISQVVANGGITGTIIVQPVAWEPSGGNLGSYVTPGSGQAGTLGGVVSNGPMSAPTILASSCCGTTTITGTVQGGTITTYGSLIGNISINGPMNGPIVSDSLRGIVLNVDGTVQGGIITTYGSVIGNISIHGAMNGPAISATNLGGAVNVNGSVQGGEITTHGSVVGTITIGGAVNGPMISASNRRAVILVNAPVQGGSITTFGSATGAITIVSALDAPSVAATNGGVVTVNVAPKGGSILTGGVLGNVMVGGTLTGQVVAIGNMNGTVAIGGPVQNGVIATNGSINGSVQVGGPLSGGEILCAGNVNGNLIIEGSLQSGRIAALGSIPGNVTITGGIDSQSALVSGGSIGGANGKLRVGNVSGIVAAAGPISVAKIGTTNQALFYGQNVPAIDATVVDAIFSRNLLSALSPADRFDHGAVFDLVNLAQIEANLKSLTFKNSRLQD